MGTHVPELTTAVGEVMTMRFEKPEVVLLAGAVEMGTPTWPMRPRVELCESALSLRPEYDIQSANDGVPVWVNCARSYDSLALLRKLAQTRVDAGLTCQVGRCEPLSCY